MAAGRAFGTLVEAARHEASGMASGSARVGSMIASRYAARMGRFPLAILSLVLCAGGVSFLATCAINPQPEPPQNADLGGAGGGAGGSAGAAAGGSGAAGAPDAGVAFDAGEDGPANGAGPLFSSGFDDDPSNESYAFDGACASGPGLGWQPDVGWSGGGVKLLPSTTPGDTCGLVGIAWPSVQPPVIHVRFLMKPGPALYATDVSAALVTANRSPYEDATRFIATLSRSGAVSGGPAHQLLLGRDTITCPDPAVHAGFFIEDLGEQWTCLEYAIDVPNNSIRLWVTSEDHRLVEQLVMESSTAEPAGTVWNTRAAPPGYEQGNCSLPPWGSGYWSNLSLFTALTATTVDPATQYMLVDEVEVAQSYIGPPPGF